MCSGCQKRHSTADQQGPTPHPGSFRRTCVLVDTPQRAEL
jgi:hypothetical protein